MKREVSRQFEYAGWDVHLQLDPPAVDRSVAGHADLSYNGAHKCRIALAGHHDQADDADALDVLGAEARAFIDDWMQRLHTGDTGFVEL